MPHFLTLPKLEDEKAAQIAEARRKATAEEQRRAIEVFNIALFLDSLMILEG